jgi:quercetin dioxygenase-like cupin family protein
MASGQELVADIGPPIMVGPLTIRFLVTGEQSHGSLALFELDVPAGAGLPGPAHLHDGYEETIYGLRGKLVWTVDGESLPREPGEVLCIPRGAVHRFENAGQTDATVLIAVSPAGIGPAYFQEVAAALAASAPGPPDPELMGEIMRRHGLTPVPSAS